MPLYPPASGGSSQWDDVTGGIDYDDGNVGVGNDTPPSKLSVTTGIGDGTLGTNNVRLQHAEDNGNSMTLLLGTSNVGKGGANQGFSYLQAAYAGGSYDNPLIMQPQDGAVGIGDLTTLHDWRLTAQGTISAVALTNDAGDYTGRIAFPASGYAGEMAWISGVYDGAAFSNGSGLVFATIQGADVAGDDGLERMRITSEGDVGINTDTPAEKLDVDGNIAVSGTVDGRDIATDGTKLDGIESGADVTDATNVAAAGATMDADTSLAGNGYFLDEDNMASNSATKVASQQSIKAYVDATAIDSNSFISDATPTGLVNSSNTSYTTATSFVAGTLEVFLNGLKQARSADYTETTPASGVFTMATAPTTGDILRVNFLYSPSVSGNADTVDGIHASSTATANQLMPLDASAKFSSGLLTNPYKFAVYHASTQTINTTDTKLSFTTEEFDTNSNFASSTYTAPVAGFYWFGSATSWAATGSQTRATLTLYKNGAAFKKLCDNDTSAVASGVVGSTFVQLAANDTIEIYGLSVGASATARAGADNTWFQGYLVSVT
jgi:hypothetical protein